ncbi:N-succinylarginine dihydrolase [Legionella sp. CNM-4043-24]|uniref:N-succinylarginine dihydrolase n=1 Tax=Legionella sp. CNM-4043-24 TaxID=3421646 RepID=UPI00403B2A19
MPVYELNMDGLVGPTHHYAGLAAGNLASMANAQRAANPQAAARQGLAKMRQLHHMGLKQAVLPPHQRPNLHLLHQLGFTGTVAAQLNKASREAPELLSACYSASSMWTANAATVSASLDCPDQRVHFTAANLVSNLHRHQEAGFSRYLLQRVFHDSRHFQHHEILPASAVTGDEGAANHSRLCARHDAPGIHLYVYGKQGLHSGGPAPIKHPARQTLEASQAIARQHGLARHQWVAACQNPQAIDQGVFHNDVIAVANEYVLLAHEQAFVNQKQVLDELQKKADFQIAFLEVKSDELSIADAVSTYLFNSQLLTLTDGRMALVAPSECEQHMGVQAVLKRLLSDSENPVSQIHYFDLKQSMRNGGGPACLRLRVPLNTQELAAMHSGVLVDDALLDQLDAWVLKHYRTELKAQDLADPLLVDEVFRALDELSTLLNLGALYPFQQEKTSA